MAAGSRQADLRRLTPQASFPPAGGLRSARRPAAAAARSTLPPSGRGSACRASWPRCAASSSPRRCRPAGGVAVSALDRLVAVRRGVAVDYTVHIFDDAAVLRSGLVEHRDEIMEKWVEVVFKHALKTSFIIEFAPDFGPSSHNTYECSTH